MKERKDFKTERVVFMASQDMVKGIEDYQFENRIKSQGQAIRDLIEYALQHKKK